MSRLPPYSWLLTTDCDTFVARAKDQPEDFPRMCMAIRVLGLAGLTVAGVIIAVTLLLSLS